ncbi:GAF domain-containing protein [Aerosakkonemataceae cyanobacterium BLCC-F154]|uniref:histidine kinase n=1 Tax=Floridaenema fluviatile BLCC-F154 TaxID=3153640 RepID=A0ABV4YGT7_9CYAN
MKALSGSQTALKLYYLSQCQTDSNSEADFDDLASLGAYICQTPIAVIRLLKGKKLLLKSKFGLSTNEAQQCEDFCTFATSQADLVVIQDTLTDRRFALHRAVQLNPKIRFYAAVPLMTTQGVILGTLSVMDYVPREISWQVYQAFQALGRQVIGKLELRNQLCLQGHQLIKVKSMPSQAPWDVAKIFESITDAVIALDNQWQITHLNSRAKQIFFNTQEELVGKNFWHEFPGVGDSNLFTECQRVVSQNVTAHFEEFYLPLGIWLEVRACPYDDGLVIYLRDVTARKQAEGMLLERSRLSAFSAEIGITLGQGGNLPDILNRCTQIMVSHLDAASAYIWTVNPAGENLQLQAVAFAVNCAFPQSKNQCFTGERAEITACNWLHPDSSIVDFITQSHQPYLNNQIQTQDSLEIKSWLQKIGSCSCSLLKAFAAYPLIVEDRLVGVMALSSRQTFSEEAYSMLEWMANAIAVAIDRTWARSELLSRRESLLFRLASQIRNSLDLDTILGIAVNEIRSLLQIDRCHFLWCWPHPEKPSLTVTHEACHPDLPSSLGDYPSEKVTNLAKKILNLEAIRVDNINNETNLDEQTRSLLNSFGITSQLLIPLQTHSGQLGAVVCSHCSGSRPWTNSEVELLKAVVDQLAIAIDQAELFAQTRAAAFAAQSQAQQLSHALQNLKQTEAQLVHTEKMSSLGQMVAGIAHEINNPVNFIYGNLDHANGYIADLLGLLHLYQQYYPTPAPEIIEEAEKIDLEFLKEDLPKLLASMQVGTERIRQIVLSLRNFSRLDEAEKKPVNIHEGIDNTLLILHSRLKGGQGKPEIQIIKEYGNLPAIECYAGQLNQVFMNIISNAIDALENVAEPRKITIRTSVVKNRSESYLLAGENQLQSNDYLPEFNDNLHIVVVSISDNGLGMSEEVRKRLFDPFFTTKPVGKGTGLGLSISYQIVAEKHGGQLRCNSAPGKGAEFVLEIPVYIGE